MRPFIIVAVAAVIIALRVTLRVRGRRAKAGGPRRTRDATFDTSTTSAKATAAFGVGELCSAL